MKGITKLTNQEMELVSGGLRKGDVRNIAGCSGIAIAAGSLVSAGGCKIANLVYRVKANNALKRGDTDAFCKFSGRANACSIASASCIGGVIAGVGLVAYAEKAPNEWVPGTII